MLLVYKSIEVVYFSQMKYNLNWTLAIGQNLNRRVTKNCRTEYFVNRVSVKFLIKRNRKQLWVTSKKKKLMGWIRSNSLNQGRNEQGQAAVKILVAETQKQPHQATILSMITFDHFPVVFFSR